MLFHYSPDQMQRRTAPTGEHNRFSPQLSAAPPQRSALPELQAAADKRLKAAAVPLLNVFERPFTVTKTWAR